MVEDYAVIGGRSVLACARSIPGGAWLRLRYPDFEKIVHAGQVMWGTPARPLKEYLTQLASLARLPEMQNWLS